MPISVLCDFSDWFSSLVAHELEQGRREHHQWRETSWTDHMLLELKRLRDPRIFVQGSDEPVTGADMDWWFIDQSGSRHLCLTIQAKKLHYLAHNPLLWAYPDIRHPNGHHGRQSRTLRAYASRETKAGRATWPLYLFYNPASAASVVDWCNHSVGVSLADGYRIAAHLEHHRLGNHIPPDATRLKALAPYMFCLHTLFCRGVTSIPTPDEIAKWLSEQDNFRVPHTRRRRPIAGDGIPERIARLIDRRGLSSEGDSWRPDETPRNTIVFISGE